VPYSSGPDEKGHGAFVRSAFTSVVATGTDFVLATILVAYATSPGYATFVGCVAGGVVAFWMNRGWAFKAQGNPLPQVIRFLGVWASSAALNSIGVGLATRFAGGPFTVVWLLVRAVVYSAWNYPLLRFFVFSRPRPALGGTLAPPDP
jgi:putative flippase GtrA